MITTINEFKTHLNEAYGDPIFKIQFFDLNKAKEFRRVCSAPYVTDPDKLTIRFYNRDLTVAEKKILSNFKENTDYIITIKNN